MIPPETDLSVLAGLLATALSCCIILGVGLLARHAQLRSSYSAQRRSRSRKNSPESCAAVPGIEADRAGASTPAQHAGRAAKLHLAEPTAIAPNRTRTRLRPVHAARQAGQLDTSSEARPAERTAAAATPPPCARPPRPHGPAATAALTDHSTSQRATAFTSAPGPREGALWPAGLRLDQAAAAKPCSHTPSLSGALSAADSQRRHSASAPRPPHVCHPGWPSPKNLDIWQAAAAPDLPQLHTFLAAHPLIPDAVHPHMRITPLLAVAHARTTDEATDVQLKLALRMLLGAHDPLLAVEPFSGNTALHILAAQRRPLIVKHRLKFLVNLMDTASWNSNMLVARNAAGKLPEDVAATHAIWLRLRRHRLSFQEQAALAGDVPHRP